MLSVGPRDSVDRAELSHHELALQIPCDESNPGATKRVEEGMKCPGHLGTSRVRPGSARFRQRQDGDRPSQEAWRCRAISRSGPALVEAIIASGPEAHVIERSDRQALGLVRRPTSPAATSRQ